MADISVSTRENWFVRPDGSSIRELSLDWAKEAKEINWRDIVTEEMRQRYWEDGVLYIPQVIHPEWLALAEQGMLRNVINPGYNSIVMHEGTPGAYLMDHDNYQVNPEYQYLYRCSPIADIVQFVLNSKNLWLFHDQIFVKRGGNSKPTMWHQDLPYWILKGTQLASMWISLDPVPKKYCLEFVQGSHRETQYGGSTFDENDPTAPYFKNLPRIPNIEADRSRFKIISWDIQPGDAIIIHPGTLHGGGATGGAVSQRRTLTTRFFGDDAVYDEWFAREKQMPSPHYPGLALKFKHGEPVRDSRFPQLRPG